MKKIKTIVFILFLFSTNSLFSQEKKPEDSKQKRPTPKEMRASSPQDTVKTQPLRAREGALYSESLKAINKNKNKYMHDLPKDFDNWSQYGIKKRFFFKFLFSVGWSLLDDYTDSNTYKSTDTMITGSFSFMAIFKPSHRRSGRLALGYGFEIGLYHLCKVKDPKTGDEVGAWGMPINFIFQIPIYKFLSRTTDMFIILGPGVYIPLINDDHDRIHFGFVLGFEIPFHIGGKIIMPVFVKSRFIFHGYDNGKTFVNNFFWGVEAGVGISF